MPLPLRYLLALLAGLVLGSVVNMGLVSLGPVLIPPPAGADMKTAEGLAKAMPLLAPVHFLFPFLAHALGTLVGALLAWWLAPAWRERLAWAVGGFFLCGGVAAAAMIPAPAWFIAADLLLAYLPMAWLAIRIGRRLRPA